ncbi:MAG: AAA family ATPase [Alphaproteobacteria bacterium]|nr:AAA family ATPase [Alphaproteobacteria bacterium]
MKTLPILLSICFLTFKTFAADPISNIDAHYPFAGIFENEKLYDDIKNDDSFEKRKEEFYKKKEEIVEKKLIKPMDEYIKKLSKKTWKEIATKIASKAFKYTLAGASPALTAGYLTAEENKKTFNYKACILTLAAATAGQLATEFLNEDPNRILKINADILKDKLHSLIKNESIKEYEELYIEKYHLYNDPCRKAAIEFALHNCRQKISERRSKIINERDLNDMLHFALDVKLLPPNLISETLNLEIYYQPETETYVNDLFTNLEHNKGPYLLNHYQGQIKYQLMDIVTTICEHSQNYKRNKETKEEKDKLPTRSSWIFYGKSGRCKTGAVRAIAASLGLPCYELKVNSTKDLDTQVLFGFHAKNGTLSQAFLEKATDKKPYKNVIILIDDVDAFLEKNPVTGALINPQALRSILQTLLEKGTDHIKDEFYKLNFDLSNVHFFITTNSDFTIGANKEQLAAINSRAETIHFPDPTYDEKRKDIESIITDTRLKASRKYYNQQNLWNDLRGHIADFILDHYDVDDIRKIEERITALLNIWEEDFQNFPAWEALAQRKGWLTKKAIKEEPNVNAVIVNDQLED